MIRALVIDDEELLCELFTQMLTDKGYEVESARNEQEALDLIRTAQFDVILLDLMLGPTSGFTLLEHIRQMYYAPIVIVMTGYGGANVAVEAMKQGATDFIMKPVTPDLLEIRIQKALEERQTLQLAITDGLTGLYNRRYFEERLEEETRRAQRYNRPMSIIMMDINYFKEYNDTMGHLLGDQVLIKIARIIHRFSRETDIPARYGGDEFVMILPETDAQNAGRLGERIRAAVEETEFKGGAQTPEKRITISVGVSCLEADETGRDVLERADQALYRSKEKGKNLVEVFTK